MKKTKLFVVAAITVVLVGCGNSRSDYVAAEIAKIKSAAPIDVEPLEQSIVNEFYMYTGQSYRSPFIPPSMANALSKNGRKTLMPDFNRIKTPLEEVGLEQLQFKGTISDQLKGAIALIQTPDGVVHRVERGAYLGIDFGRIVSISPQAINLIEIIPNANEGYVERPRRLVVVGSNQPK